MKALRAAVLGLALMPASTAALAQAPKSDPGVGGGDRIVGAPFSTRAPVIAVNGMAATAQPLATMIAIDVLKKGGSAVDAAIAANAALGLMEPTGCGIGGDLYAIVWDPRTGKLHGLNASGRAPLGRSYDQLKAKLGDRTAIPRFGSLAVSVPGAVDGWFELHAKFGKLPMADILAPSIAYARDGFPVSELIAFYFDRNLDRLGDLADQPGSEIEEFANARATYAPGGKTPAQGEIFKNPDLARTYELIAAGGRDAFYKGEIAKTIDAYMKRIGGDLRYEDLAAHRSTWEDPACVDYRGVQVCGLGPNTQGYATLQMLSILKNFDLKAMGAGSPAALHAMIEAKRLAYEDIARFYADPAFSPFPKERLLSDAYGAERAKLIDPAKAMAMAYPGEAPAQGDTTYLTVADKDGMMVSLIQSNFRGMGSGWCPTGSVHVPEPRRALRARARPPQRLRAGQAPVPDDHPRLRAQGRQALALLRRHGRRHAAPRPGADRRQHGRFRDERSGGRRRRALASRRLVRADGREGARRRRCARRRRHKARDARRARSHGPQAGRERRQLRRLSGDPARPRHGRLLGRERDAQGRRGDGVLRRLRPRPKRRRAIGRRSGQARADASRDRSRLRRNRHLTSVA